MTQPQTPTPVETGKQTDRSVGRRFAARQRGLVGLRSRGEPMLFVTGTSLAIAVTMILGLLTLVLSMGVATFWPGDLVEIETIDGRVLLGEISKEESFRLERGALSGLKEKAMARAASLLGSAHDFEANRTLVRTGNFELTDTHFDWVSDFEETGRRRPLDAALFERTQNGRFYGTPVRLLLDGKTAAEGAEAAWRGYEELSDAVAERRDRAREIEETDLGRVAARLEASRLAVREAELEEGQDSPAYAAALEASRKDDAKGETEFAELKSRIAELRDENARHVLVVRTSTGAEAELPLDTIVRAMQPNRLSFMDKVSVYLSRWGEFLSAEPRAANAEGGVLPAIFGTVVMTLVMSLFVAPFGVLAALYLREYAKSGIIVSLVRIAINNLAGVPSIVFGVFGLGFFCYILGSGIDQTFFAAKLPSPTFGTGGIMWAGLTLSLLTLPVVIVASEEALAAVPGSMREGSYACGASKWQTIRRIVLPRALPGIMTGMILAMARGAGEVAPLMLVGAMKLAPSLPVDGVFPYIHPERSFMHLGFHIYDLGFQSQNSEAAKPMVYTTTLLLIVIIVVLNLLAIRLRSRLARRFKANHF